MCSRKLFTEQFYINYRQDVLKSSNGIIFIINNTHFMVKLVYFKLGKRGGKADIEKLRESSRLKSSQVPQNQKKVIIVCRGKCVNACTSLLNLISSQSVWKEIDWASRPNLSLILFEFYSFSHLMRTSGISRSCGFAGISSFSPLCSSIIFWNMAIPIKGLEVYLD